MVIGAIVAVCVVLLVLAFVFPRLSRHPQRGVDSTLSAGQKAGGILPGFLGRWAQKPFGKLAQGHQQERRRRPQGPRQASRLTRPQTYPPGKGADRLLAACSTSTASRS